MIEGFDLLAQSIITGNLVFMQGLGLYALTRYTKSVKEAAKSGGATLVAMLLGSLILWVLNGVTFHSPSAEVGLYLLVGAVSALVAQRLFNGGLSLEDGLFDSALVGSLLLMGQANITGASGIWAALGAGVGYLLALLIMATLRERMEMAPVPACLKGAPLVLITAGMLAIALLGFRF